MGRFKKLNQPTLVKLDRLDSPIAEQEGRFIQDNFMLLDITKAFDSVSWPFLIEEGLLQPLSTRDYSTLSLQVPWAAHPIVDKIANQLPGWKADFVLVQSVLTGIGNGASTLFWSDRWTVQEAIEDNGWINDIPGSLSRIWKTWAPPKCRFFLWLWWHQTNEAIQGLC
ncbi:hypothetical protein ACJX0J_020568 [Zea mays]